MKYFIMILFIVTALFSDSNEHYNERHINKELSHLNLSKTQTIKVKKILKDFMSHLKEFREYKEEIKAKREKLFIDDVFKVDEIDRLNKALDAKSHEIENRLLESLHSILSQQQRKDFIYYFDDWEVE
ncbi:hypothetical protein [Candidatus Sulfurimonas baltica]|uniref:Periplasmic heavy metal sensor n=1 Tax=Candidatus Sulfurimonas baltica TaxID=2740404 RepID=A0A7S7LUD3_9BACT|nr:hypothetical protein [Candidatus Sulfurimonas baltica]QOY51033.1 hypothetical protein HUE88_07735 [Candidatus Sulfurimonas baltica]